MVFGITINIPELTGDFQYSLCRVVLMVLATLLCVQRRPRFQYSLCRVVLMVSFHLA